LPIRKVVPFEFIYPLAKFGNFWRIRSAIFGIFKFELVEILEKWTFQFGLGLSPVLQYQPKPTRTASPLAIFPCTRVPGCRSDRAAVGSDRANYSCAPCHLPLTASTRRPCRSSTCAGFHRPYPLPLSSVRSRVFSNRQHHRHLARPRSATDVVPLLPTAGCRRREPPRRASSRRSSCLSVCLHEPS
jgi:hypothetical protein